MTLIRLTPKFTNGNRRRRQIQGHLIGSTPDWWVIREIGADRNQVLPYEQWEKSE